VDEHPVPGASDRAATSPGRALLVYSLLRLGLLVVCFVALRLILGAGASPLLVVGGAVLMSALLSIVLLKRQRDAFAEASLARAERRRAEKSARRSRLESPESPQG
jgi:hypothetical protein